MLVAAFVLSALVTLGLRFVDPPTSAYMLRDAHQARAEGRHDYRLRHVWVDWRQISPNARVAVVAAEDQRFPEHPGFDLDSIADAVYEHAQGGRQRGASTISQQVAKNLFLWPSPSYLRKGIEAWITFLIEALWSKQRILEMYLNVAQFGPCLFGAAAASDRFFGVPPLELTPEQAALLATVLPNPKRLRAHNPGPYASERRAEILELMTTHRGRRHLRDL